LPRFGGQSSLQASLPQQQPAALERCFQGSPATHSLSMFQDRSYKRTFYSAPQSVTSLVAAVLEPTLIVLVYLATALWFREPIMRPDLVLCLLVFALTFPGRNRYKEGMLNAATDLVASWITLLAILLLCAYATDSMHYFDRNVLLGWSIATPLVQWLAVWVGRAILRKRAQDLDIRKPAVVIGAGLLGVKVASALQGDREEGRDFLGWFDDRTDERLAGETSGHMLGGLKDAAPFIRAHGVKEVFITLPLGSQPRILELLESIQGTTASLFFVPDVFGISIIQGRLQDMNGVPVVGICETPFTGTNELVKRISDVVLAVLILLLISPLLLAIMVGVKMSSPGPAIFRQKRNGLDGGEITVYKFRSMRAMDNGPVVAQATKDDPRITPFGAFLRKTSLDELPQFFNVLQGRMSIVGPRPHAVAHNELYRELISAYMVRHKVKPGITGWAQVNGLRGETETVDKMKARVEYDLEYLRNWSLGLDLQIIVRTVRVLFFDRNAY
jgi:putative colanic acid biosysnthesis UDP-glucose lipid carrier transferase